MLTIMSTEPRRSAFNLSWGQLAVSVLALMVAFGTYLDSTSRNARYDSTRSSCVTAMVDYMSALLTVRNAELDSTLAADAQVERVRAELLCFQTKVIDPEGEFAESWGYWASTLDTGWGLYKFDDTGVGITASNVQNTLIDMYIEAANTAAIAATQAEGAGALPWDTPVPIDPAPVVRMPAADE